jgi:hypothetical protein
MLDAAVDYLWVLHPEIPQPPTGVFLSALGLAQNAQP